MAETMAESRSSRPPSYTDPSPPPVAAPAYTGPPPQQVIYMPQGGVVPQQGYVIQNVPVPAQTGCCGSRSDGFKHIAGVTTGVIHLVAAVVSIVLSVFTYVLIDEVDDVYVGMGGAIGGAVILFIPAGILGALTKRKNSCVIVGYLVMTILSAIHAVCVVGVEIPAAIFSSYKYDCDYPQPDYFFGRVSGSAPIMERDDDMYFECGSEMVVSVLVIHIALAVVNLIEFISAIVGAAYCCGGLRCCCSQATQPQGTATMMYYTPVGQPQAIPSPGQVAVQVAPGVEAGPLPQKA